MTRAIGNMTLNSTFITYFVIGLEEPIWAKNKLCKYQKKTNFTTCLVI